LPQQLKKNLSLMQDPKIVWKPHPGSQTLALSCPANVIVYHGTRGPGKTDAQLIRFRRNVGVGYGQFWRGIIFDREYKNLDDLVSKSMRWFPEIGDTKARFLSSKSDYRWVWPTGEQLLFRTLKRPTDYWGYHGQEFPFIGWNELTKYPTEELFEAMMSCNRSSFLPKEHPLVDAQGNPFFLPEIPLEVFATCNPYGAGHNWVKKRFINAMPMGKMLRKTVNVFNPRTQKQEDIVKTQVHLFGSYKENKNLSPEYVAELESITDPNRREAWLKGNWDIVAGGMFDDVWDSLQHVVSPFEIPPSWVIRRSFDWGSSAPFSVGWWAESDGCDLRLANGSWTSTVKGDLYRIMEWYGTTGKTNQGLRLLNSKIAEGIVARELAAGIHGRVQKGPADNSIWDVANGNSIAADMAKEVVIREGQFRGKYKGVEWVRSDKSSGSRKAGWNKIRQYLDNAKAQYIVHDGVKRRIPREFPGLFVFNTCKYFIDLFPILPRDEEDMDDVDSDAEDHIGDEVRYMLLSVGLGAKTGKTKGVQ
jgi:hypothetical protein